MTKAEEVVLARMVNMRLNIDGFEEATLKTLEKNYKAAIKALLVDVQKAKGKLGRIWTNTRLIKVLEETQLQHRAIVEALSNSVAGSVADVGVYSYSEMNNIVGWDGLAEGFNDVTIPRARLLQLTKVTKIGGKDLAEWVGSALEPDLDAIKAQIATGVIRGQGYDKMVRAIKDELDLVKGSKKARDMETVVKSYVQSMNVAAQEEVYAANEDILDKVEWSAIMENGNFATGRGTCPRCMALDGQQWGLKESRPDCPLHPRCRCLLYPVTKSWDDLLPGRGLADLKEPKYKTPWNIRNLDTKQRQIIARGKQYGDYEVFWRDQGFFFQNNAIGPKRAAMVRNGMPFKSIIDKDGNLIPIRDLPQEFIPVKLKPKPKPKPKKTKPPKLTKAEKATVKQKKELDTKVMPTMAKIKREFRKSEEGKNINKEMNRLSETNKLGQDVLTAGGLNPKRIARIEGEIKRRNERIQKLEERKLYTRRTQIRETIRPPEGGNLKVAMDTVNWRDPDNIYSSKEAWDWNRKDLVSLLHPDILDRMPMVKVQMNGGVRAHYKNGKNIIRMGDDSTETFIHEFGHHIEENGKLYKKAVALRKARTVGEDAIVMYINKQGQPEISFVDKWFTQYVGRKYPFKSTELISMGLEKMYLDPLDFFDTDPEYFEFILKIMWDKWDD